MLFRLQNVQTRVGPRNHAVADPGIVGSGMIPPPSFPLALPYISFPCLSLPQSGPLNPARGLGERCKGRASLTGKSANIPE